MRNPDKGQPPLWEHTTFVSPFLPPSIAAYEWRDLRLPWTRYWSVRTVSTVYSHVNSAVYLPNIFIVPPSPGDSRRLGNEPGVDEDVMRESMRPGSWVCHIALRCHADESGLGLDQSAGA